MEKYGLFLTAGLAAAFLLYFIRSEKELRPGAPLCMGVSVLTGLIFSRLIYWLCSLSLYTGQGLSSLPGIRDGGLSMTGALLGAALGCAVSCRCLKMKERTLETADSLFSAAPAFILAERLGEWLALEQGYGWDVDPCGILSVRRGQGYALNTPLIEAAAALLMLLFLLARKKGRPGSACALFALLYGITQTFLESLRLDRHMMWDFVHAQQIFAALGAVVTVLLLSRGNRKTMLRSILMTALLALATVLTELGVNSGTRVPLPFDFMYANGKLWRYGFFAAILILYLIYGLKRVRAAGKPKEK